MTIFNILLIRGHFQRAISNELLDLNISFIYQITHLNVLFKNALVCWLEKFCVRAFRESDWGAKKAEVYFSPGSGEAVFLVPPPPHFFVKQKRRMQWTFT